MNALLFGPGTLGMGDGAALFLHFFTLSLLAIGGAITTVPDMQRFVVGQHGWLSDAQFTASVALAQAAPGPNVLFVAVIGFNVGGLAGMVATMVGTLLPSTTLAMLAAHWCEKHREAHSLRAITTGLAPLTIGLLLATGWILLEPVRTEWTSAVLVVLTLWVMQRTHWSPLWPLCVGALAGVLGWV
jgi:chromate transporter